MLTRNRTAVAALAVSVLVRASAVAPTLAAADPPVRDAEVVRGIAEVDSGEYDSAMLRLEAATRRLAGRRDRRHDLVQAYVYLAVAYLAKGHETSAKNRFRDALAQDSTLRLTSETFSPRVVEVFEKARDQMAGSTSPVPSTGPSLPPILEERFSGLTPGTNQFFDVTVQRAGTLEVTLDWSVAGHDLDTFLATPACTNTSSYPPDVCPVLARAESPITKPELFRVPVKPGPYRIVVTWCGDPVCGTGTETGTVRAVLRAP